MNELDDEERIDADVYILADTSVYADLRIHTYIFKNIVILACSIKKETLSEIMRIFKNKDVLIVNDTFERTIETAATFYASGIGHLNLVFYKSG